MMAVAAWLMWKRGGFAVQRGPLGMFLAQLVLNAAWTPLEEPVTKATGLVELLIAKWLWRNLFSNQREDGCQRSQYPRTGVIAGKSFKQGQDKAMLTVL